MTSILYCHTSAEGGAELAAPALAAELGSELWIRGDGRIAELARDRGVAVTILKRATDSRTRSIVKYIFAVAELARLQVSMIVKLRSEQPAVVVSNTIQGLLHLAIPAVITRTPLVAYVRDLGNGGNRPSFEVNVFRALLKLTVGVIYNSELTRSSWRVDRPHRVSATAVAPQFYDLWRGDNANEVLMVGRVTPWKGQANVVRALNSLGNPDLSLRLVGGALFGDAGALPPASFTIHSEGHVSEPWTYFTSSGLLVHASQTPEPFGQVLAQAAAAGIPIVCASVGGHTEWLKDAHNCVYADATRPEAIASAISKLLSDPTAARLRSQRARAAAETFREDRAYIGLDQWLADLVSMNPARTTP